MKTIFIAMFASILLLSTIFITSCEKAEADAAPMSQSISYKGIQIEFVDGMIVLASEADFINLHQSLVADEMGLVNSLNAIEGFVSAFEAYTKNVVDAATDIPLESSIFKKHAHLNNYGEVEPLIDHQLMRHIANENHVFRIGDNVMVVERNQVVKVPLTVYANNRSVEQLIEAGGLELLPIDRRVVSEKNTGEIGERSNVSTCDAQYGPYSNPRKVKGYIKEIAFMGLVECKAETKHLRKGALGAFWAEKADQLEQIGCIEVNGNGGACFSINMLKNNVSSLEKLFYVGYAGTFVSGPGYPFTASLHKAKEGNAQGQCSTLIY